MARYFGAALAAFFLISGQAQAQQQAPAPFPMPNMMQGTPQEQAACAPDSAKFCKRFEPDALQVLGCLQQNRGRLTKSCQSVLANRGV